MKEPGMGKRIEDVQELSKRYDVRRLTEEDMKALPPRMTYDDKYYIGYFEGERLTAVMDLILGYPNEETALVGLFMMEKSSQGKGIGSAIAEECFEFLRSTGYRFVRLGFAKGNPQSEAFWVKNGFVKTGVEADNGNYIMVVMERCISA